MFCCFVGSCSHRFRRPTEAIEKETQSDALSAQWCNNNAHIDIFHSITPHCKFSIFLRKPVVSVFFFQPQIRQWRTKLVIGDNVCALVALPIDFHFESRRRTTSIQHSKCFDWLAQSKRAKEKGYSWPQRDPRHGRQMTRDMDRSMGSDGFCYWFPFWVKTDFQARFFLPSSFW